MRIIVKRVVTTEIEVADEAALEALEKAFRDGDKDVNEYCAEHGISGDSAWSMRKVKE